jgi:hypothetical protein
MLIHGRRWSTQVSQSSLTSFARPVEAVNDVGRAFGPQYAAQLKKQAGDRPERLQRSKHQIGSLYYDAKVRELEMFVRPPSPTAVLAV